MKKQEIQEVALQCFAQNGYNGTSLSQIAEAVQLKKQSLYTHFKDKDAIFLSALRHAKEVEIAFYDDFFSVKKPLLTTLHDFVEALDTMFYTSPTQQFWLRMNFSPPAHLSVEVKEEVHQINEALREKLLPLFEENKALLHVETAIALEACIALIDACILHLIFHEETAVIAKKREALWLVYERGVLK